MSIGHKSSVPIGGAVLYRAPQHWNKTTNGVIWRMQNAFRKIYSGRLIVGVLDVCLKLRTYDLISRAKQIGET